jgi:hypothetical protein
MAICCVVTAGVVAHSAEPRGKPVFREFVGLNTHTVQFKPELYKPIAKHVRDYHPFSWDVGDETDYYPQFPFARNRVDWNAVYGSWKKSGYVTHVSVMFDDTPPQKWKDLSRDAWAYGFEFARFFGPSGREQLVESVEIGNEPGKYDDASYRVLFENAASGMRKADPRLVISTCSTLDGPSGDWHKSLEVIKGLETLYDVINVHSYAFAEQYPTWRRSFPEDPAIDFLKDLQKVIDWRNAHAPGKQVWLTEFGWDASTRPPADEGTFKDWVDVTDEQQAQYLVRALLVLSGLDMDRAYIYWFNDSDEPSLHASSGLTRNFEPKPAFHAVAHLVATLGDYRFARVIRKDDGERFAYEFVNASNAKQRIWAVWSPTGADREAVATLEIDPHAILKAERMPLAAGDAQPVEWKTTSPGAIAIPISESPVYLWIEE